MNLNINGHKWLVATILDNIALDYIPRNKVAGL